MSISTVIRTRPSRSVCKTATGKAEYHGRVQLSVGNKEISRLDHAIILVEFTHFH